MEVLLLSYALTKRFQWERSANIETILEAKTQLVEKTQENERIVKEQNIILEKRVNERTIELNKTNNLLYNTLKTVEQEKAKSDALLLNILPKSTADELKEFGAAQPRNFRNVSILFTDFIDFTTTTNNMSPSRLVEDLNECFKAFDLIVKDLKMEKIKTIGDSYMAASGLPNEHDDHAILAVKCAMKMMDFINIWQKKRLDHGHEVWKIRIGIHSGPVVGGVVGDHKFAFDIWGDAVNIASRMESNSTEGKINISDATYQLVRDHFKCIPRGKLFVKGKGEMDMFWVEKQLQPV
jgi:class 3 adenylate cyclase